MLQALTLQNSQIKNYRKLVETVVNSIYFTTHGKASKDDMMQDGYIGLLDAFSKFNDDCGATFETYASWRIRGSVIDGLRQGDWVSRNIRKNINAVNKASEKHRGLDGVIDVAKASAEVGISVNEFHQTTAEKWLSTMASNETHDGLPLDELIGITDENHTPYDIAEAKQMAEILHLHMKTLSFRERDICQMRWFREMTLKEIGIELNLTEGRIKQITDAILVKLRKRFNL